MAKFVQTVHLFDSTESAYHFVSLKCEPKQNRNASKRISIVITQVGIQISKLLKLLTRFNEISGIENKINFESL